MRLLLASVAICASVVVVATAAQQPAPAIPQQPAPESSPALRITALSTDAALVSGGDVLIGIGLPDDPKSDARPDATSLKVTVNGQDVTSRFHPITKAAPSHMGLSRTRLMGLVDGLHLGANLVQAETHDGRWHAALEVVNYPITGPVISGPWQQPFVCQTEVFELPDGRKLGAALDAACSTPTVVQYLYLPTDARRDRLNPFKMLPSVTSLPDDLATTTTATGVTVNFIVRVETATINRGIYQNAVLFDPTVDAEPTPFMPPPGWNRRLVALHGWGCPGGWYVQGAAQGAALLDVGRLAQGDAIFVNTLNHPANNCNAFLAGETAMMGKEHFIETFGPPLYTLSLGGSGGAYNSLQIADAFPGLIDAVDISQTFPDALTLAVAAMDARLLLHYFARARSIGLTEAQKVAVSGHAGMRALIDAANESQRLDPVAGRSDADGYRGAVWTDAVPRELRYDPGKNPRGARPTLFDAARNIYGVDPVSGAARRPYDNIGVQYGLAALNDGTITQAQFLDLNERIGGVDVDATFTSARAGGDPGAIMRAYQSGLILGANGGLRAVPIFDDATSTESARYHYGWFHFALRERIRRANEGRSDTMVMWRSTSPGAPHDVIARWMAALSNDASPDPPSMKLLRAKPADATDGCFDPSHTPPIFVIDSLPFERSADTRCAALYPVYSNPRVEAGGPLAADVLKCTLKPVTAEDYQVPWSPDEWARLLAAFPDGVCDWSRPGVNQVAVVPWASFGPSPRNLIAEDLPVPAAR